ncbi:60S ribosomal export protein NMD3 [Medicago truncatula]|uniref:Nonsense-mediated mRNA decay protein n=1 Tax=Medicago truncatula TaxID=3880 RepID=G7K353_MEDTR|nr:60S ribosomal export protein NMD3 [Medicago truncatula]AET00225.1 nonsense-mediated mRNA decay protein [Medicago truncatula]
MEQGWRSVVKVRQQHVSQLRTVFHLEQISVMTNLGILDDVEKIIYDVDQGFSFCFNIISCAWYFATLIGDIVPVKSNWAMIIPRTERYLFSVEIVPICCGDLIFLPPNVVASLGPNIGPIVICTRVAKTFTLLDPFTLTHCFLDAHQYWKAPFTHSFNRTQLVEYVVLDIVLLQDNQQDNQDEEEEVVEENREKKYAAAAAAAKKYRLADAVVARVKDTGNNDTTFQIRTHLGRILKPGDHALGYDLSGGEGGADTNTNNNLPAAILISKISYAEVNGRVVAVKDKWESDYQLFFNDLQQDPQLLFKITAAYRNPNNHYTYDGPFVDPPTRPFDPLEDLLDG